MYDLLLRGGTVFDGTGAPGFRADVAVAGDRIARIGDLCDASAAETLDIVGRVVCPGFVDTHNHAYNQDAGGILSIPHADNLVRQGITTVLSGACGGSGYPVGEHLAQVATRRIHSNYAAMVGYGTVKAVVAGTEQRNPSRREMNEISARLRDAMAEGAFGVATGILGHSQDATSTEELIEAARAVAPYGGIYHSHIRDEGEWGRHLDAHREVVRIAREGGVSALSSHIKLWGRLAWGDAPRVDAIYEAAEREGLDVHADQYGYAGAYRGMGALVSELVGRMAPEDIRREPPLPDVLAAIEGQFDLIGGPGHVILCLPAAEADLDGKTLLDAACARGMRPAALAHALLQRHYCAGAPLLHVQPYCCWLAMREEDVEHFLAAPYTTVCTDGDLRIPNDEHCHPRNYGNYPRILGHYVRERGVLRLEEAIHKMTQRPAQKVGLKDRGVLTAGAFADLVVFDPETVADLATWQTPHRYPAGIEHVLVNGRFAVRGGVTTDERPGRVIRRGAQPRPSGAAA